MAAVSNATTGVLLPFYGQTSSAESTAAASPTPEPQDIVDIQASIGGSFTADARDAFSLSSLYSASGATIAGYKVALGDNSGGNGQLLLDGKDVTGQTSFTADQFAGLQYVAGADGSSESIEVVAQTGTRLSDGSLFNEVDSPAVQITANVTGTRSINAASALLTQPKGADAAEIAIAQQASIFTGFNGAARPSVTTVGNFTSDATDTYSVSDLFNASPAAGGGGIVGYKVALGDSSGANGQLLLDGKDVTSQTSFTADQFAKLQYVAPGSGSQSLEVIAQTGTVLADGSLFNEIDSPAVQITNSVTGTRSINAANALLTPLTGTDAASIAIAQSANIFGGFNGAARPSLTTVGNFTADGSDKYSLSDLYTAKAASGGGAIVGYRVALGDSSGANGQLLLDGKDVTGQTTFTADEFANLQYVAGTSGSGSIEVAAQTGTRLSDGSLFNEIDSPAVQITASVTGTRSLNAASALLTQPKGADAAEIAIAQQANIFTGFNGAARPSLTTLGNFTSAAKDAYSVSDLFNASPATGGGTIVSYKVALGDSSGANGQLLLDGQDVTGQTSFTADQFAKLQYVAPGSGSQSLEVLAQTGTVLADGSLFNEIDSPAVQITNSVTGTRSINAANALLTPVTGPDAASIAVAQSANIFGGFNGAARPSLTTVGNFTVDASDKYSLSDLYTAKPASGGGAIVGYRVALGDSSGANGQLLLDGKDVTGQTTFTADQFASLQYVAGTSGSGSIEVAAQTGTRLSDGSLFNEVDSPAVQIIASVTGTRSLNAVNALLTQPTGSDAAAIAIAQQASIFTGFNGAARPTLNSVGDLSFSPNSLNAANPVAGGFQSTVPITAFSANLSKGSNGIGASTRTGLTTANQAAAQASLLLALGGSQVGGSQSSAATSILQLYAYAAYDTSGAPAKSSSSISA